MARRTTSRMDLRRMAEAADAREGDGADGEAAPKKAKAKTASKAKSAAKKPTKRTKEKVAPRRMMMWAVYNGNMKEEARFPYAERKSAEEKLVQLREKSAKKLFFIQPIKVPLGDAAVAASLVADEIDTDDEPPKAVARDEEE